MKIFYFLAGLILGLAVSAQAQINSQRSAEAEAMMNTPIIKYSRNILLNSSDDKVARNLLVVHEVSSFKMGDEKLAKSFDKVENNKTYNKKMDKAFAKLSNDKRRNQKNEQIVNILNETGEKLYNILTD